MSKASRLRSGTLLAGLLLAAPARPAPQPAFVDRAAEWGLAFRYDNGATGQLYYPEIVGGGVALFDYDNDGDLDVFFVQGTVLEPGKAAAHPIAPAGGRLFRNDLIVNGVRHDKPRFVDVTEASGIKATGYGMGVATGDFDNDGWVDLYVLNFGSNQLWHNNGDGTFSDVTRAAGADDPRMSLSASAADLDRDGWLDLYVADYVDFAIDHNVVCYAQSSRRDYCGPSSFPPVPARLLHNRGNGTFEDVSQKAGIAAKPGRGMGVVAADFDGDGLPDVFVANDGMENFLWKNRGHLMFEETALPAGVAVNADGKVQANMGIAAGDFDDDGDLDLFVTHLDGETNTLWVNLGGGSFEDRTLQAGLAAPSLPFTGFGTAWIDYDGDGRLDLLAVNGAVRLIDAQAQRGDPFPYAQMHQMFRNVGGNRFADVSREMGEAFQRAEVGRGAAFGDIDDDGDTDVIIVAANGPARLLVNETGNRNPWLGLRLVGRPPGAKGERDMLGALVEVVRKGAPSLKRRAATDGSYASASDPRVLVGLGDAAEVTEVRVTWPDGKIEVFPPPPLRVYTKLVEGTGRTPSPPASPRP
ncbi:MAG TPA: CRTAC1 family protein [Thermoanaerobaculia bacterium]|nr:CRTAC1 family protein [Thermoanaerobaculia bacterium]